jgi:pyruvate,orthophosphate dikinase
MVELVEDYKEVYRSSVADPFPENPFKQLELAIEAVLKSWDSAAPSTAASTISRPARHGRQRPDDGLRQHGRGLGHGRRFTRNPSTGENKFYGEFLINAQGEDVVAGIRTPEPASEMSKWDKKRHAQLIDSRQSLEKHYKDMQDIEFTIERGKLFMLQTRTGKRTGAAAREDRLRHGQEKADHEQEALLNRIPPAT